MKKIVFILIGLFLLGATYTGLPIAPTNAVMKEYPSWQYFSVLRLGVNSIGDAPPQWFVPSKIPCTIAGGDVGSQVPTVDGGCFNTAKIDNADVREWGAVGNGSIFDSTAIQAAATFMGTIGGGNVTIPPTGAAYIINAGIILPQGVHLVGAGGLNWTSPIDNIETHWTAKSSWFHCKDTVNPCITLNGNSSSIEGINFWYTQSTPVGGACSIPCTYNTYSPTIYPYTILVSPTANVGDWIINDSIVNASHCIDWEGPTSGVSGIYSGMDRDNFGCFDVGTRFHLIDDTLTLSRLRYEMWWEQGNAQWWYAQQGAAHVDWDVEYLANPQITDVEFTFGGVAMKFADACVTSGFGNICFAAAGMQGKGISFNENCEGMVAASATTHITGWFTGTIIYSDSSTSPVSGQCAEATPYFLNLASDNIDLYFNGIDGGFVQSLAFIGGGGNTVHGQLHIAGATVQKYSAYTTGAPAIATDATGSFVDFNGGTPLFYPGTSAGPFCSEGGIAGAGGCQSNSNSFIGQLELGGAASTTREILFTQLATPQSPSFNLGTPQWGMRADAAGNFYFDRFNSSGNFIDPPWYVVPLSSAANNTQFQITGEAVLHGGNYMVPILISALPTCGASNAGMVETISNGVSSPTYNSVVSSTGSSAAHVFCNNSNWVYQ